MKLSLARVLPVVFALLVPSAAFAESPKPKAHATHTAGHTTKRAKAAPKAHKAVKAKPAKAAKKPAKSPAKLSKRAAK
jgi:hypothetical protein